MGRAGIAAFFDLDGTLCPTPSLERRFFRAMRQGRVLSAKSYFYWLLELLRLALRGLGTMLNGNKSYLRGVMEEKFSASLNALAALEVYREGMERLRWHATQGHQIVLLTGTLEPLAMRVASLLGSALKRTGCDPGVHVRATRLGQQNGRFSGKVAGEPVCGLEKANAIRRLAVEWRLDLEQCSAYGNSASDRWMLASVGKPCAVNPTGGLRRIARLYQWPVIHWNEAVPLRTENARNWISDTAKRTESGRFLEQSSASVLTEIPG